MRFAAQNCSKEVDSNLHTCLQYSQYTTFTRTPIYSFDFGNYLYSAMLIFV